MPLSAADWEKCRGAECPLCHRESYQLLPAGDATVCRACVARLREMHERTQELRARFVGLKPGALGPSVRCLFRRARWS